MNRYQPSTPRTLIGIAAFAFSALTLSATVALAAKTSFTNPDAGTMAAARETAALMAAAPDFRLRLDVVGLRPSNVAAAAAAESRVKPDRRG